MTFSHFWMQWQFKSAQLYSHILGYNLFFFGSMFLISFLRKFNEQVFLMLNHFFSIKGFILSNKTNAVTLEFSMRFYLCPLNIVAVSVGTFKI